MQMRGRDACWNWFFALALHFYFYSAVAGGGDSRYLADDRYKYKANFTDGRGECLTFSLEATIAVSYRYSNSSDNSTAPVAKVQEFELPNNTVTNVYSHCSNSTRMLSLSWPLNDNLFNITFSFSVNKSDWYLAQVLFSFDLDGENFDSPFPDYEGHQSYRTSENLRSLFNRTFGLNNYFHCKACKRVWLTDSDNGSDPCFKTPDTNKTVCSFLELSNSVIFIGDLDANENVKKKLCIEDFIELQEIIIPSVVGGILALLLVVIFAAYLIAFIRRRRKEGYETINDGY